MVRSRCLAHDFILSGHSDFKSYQPCPTLTSNDWFRRTEVSQPIIIYTLSRVTTYSVPSAIETFAVLLMKKRPNSIGTESTHDSDDTYKFFWRQQYQQKHFYKHTKEKNIKIWLNHAQYGEGLEKSEPANYRPISNLNTIGKLLERLVLVRLQPHINGSSFNEYQSAYRAGHSTETALLRITNDALRAADDKMATVLMALDLSAAFDTINHDILIRRLRSCYGITGMALALLSSYLENRSQVVRVGKQTSTSEECSIGVPQGSVLGPLLFTAFISPVANVAAHHSVQQHQYADDTTLYVSMSKSDKAQRVEDLQRCLQSLHEWFAQNGLALNPDKTDVVSISLPNMAASNRDRSWWNQCCRYQHQTGRPAEESRCHTGSPTQLRSSREKCVQKLILPHPSSATHSTLNQHRMCEWDRLRDYQHSPGLLQLSSGRHISTKHSRPTTSSECGCQDRGLRRNAGSYLDASQGSALASHQASYHFQTVHNFVQSNSISWTGLPCRTFSQQTLHKKSPFIRHGSARCSADTNNNLRSSL